MALSCSAENRPHRTRSQSPPQTQMGSIKGRRVSTWRRRTCNCCFSAPHPNLCRPSQSRPHSDPPKLSLPHRLPRWGCPHLPWHHAHGSCIYYRRKCWKMGAVLAQGRGAQSKRTTSPGSFSHRHVYQHAYTHASPRT